MRNNTTNICGNEVNSVIVDNSISTTNIYLGEERRRTASIDPEDLYEKRPAINIVIRVLISVLSVLADLAAIPALFDLLKGRNSENDFFTYISAAMQGKDNKLLEATAPYAIVFLVVFLMFLVSWYLIASCWRLLSQSRYQNLRRMGLTVFRVKTMRCPLCGHKLELRYNGGNVISCKQSPVHHNWAVNFPIEIKKQNR